MKNGSIKKVLIFMAAIIFFGLISLVITDNYVSADEETTTVRVEGYLDYDKAFEVLDILNESRKDAGLNELVMDKKMLDSAMTRAFETSVFFSHDRPDNSKYYSIDNNIYGENIAAGRSTAQGTFDQWWNSDGHRKNMMKSGYNCIGIGAVKVNGIYYWSQEFGYDLRKKITSEENDTEYKTIVVDIDNLSIYKGIEGDINAKTGSILNLEVYNQNKGFSYASVKLENTHIIWKSSNEKIASITDDGNIKCLSAGSTVITAIFRGTNKVMCKWNLTLTGADVSEKVINDNIKLKKSAVKKLTVLKNRKIKVKLKKVSGATAYQVEYATNKLMRESRKRKTKKTTINLKKFKRGKTVYVRVRSIKTKSTGKTVYSKWSKIKKIVVR